MSDDSELIRRYAREADENAFATIVQRYVDLVFSAAVRMVQDPHLAQDISQTVFLRLARKAPELRESTILAGMLLANEIMMVFIDADGTVK